MTAARPRKVFMESRYVAVDDHAEVLRLCGNLLRVGKQFAVCPWPNDLKSTVQTHWCVSWPAMHVTQENAAA